MSKPILYTPYSLLLRLGTLVAGTVLLLFLRESFAGRLVIDPIAFSIGPLDVRWYGLVIAGAILVGLSWTVRRAAAGGIALAVAEPILWWAVAGGIAGARLGYVVQNLSYYGSHLLEALAVTDGGLSIHGALLGGFLAAWLASRRAKISWLQMTDAAVPAVLLGMILGRFGNFTNHELFGPPTDLPWRMFIPPEFQPEGLATVAFYHPTFLYDAILNLVLLFSLLRIDRKVALSPPSLELREGQRASRWASTQPGQLTLLFLLGIATTRFVVEFWRLGEVTPLGLTSAQLVSLVIAGLAGAALVWSRLSHPESRA